MKASKQPGAVRTEMDVEARNSRVPSAWDARAWGSGAHLLLKCIAHWRSEPVTVRPEG